MEDLKPVFWGEKRYHSLDWHLKHVFGEKLYKISLNGHMSCPNRDGTLGDRGCIFCSQGGSGDFASDPGLSVTRQIETGKKQAERINEQVISLIFRHTPTLMLPFLICAAFLQKQSFIPIYGSCPLPPGRTVWIRLYFSFLRS